MSNQSTVNFRALQTANEQRTAYGLRYHDFARYRKHCANRTHRLRSTLKMTHGKGRDFKKLPAVSLDAVKGGNLELQLFEAERAWAYSQELQVSPDARHHATSRFRRAVNWSTQLLSTCQSLHSSSRLSTSSLLEITVYTLILNGRFMLFRYAFEDALSQLAVARHLLDVLAENASTSRDQALYVLFSDQIGPEIRYSAHELGRDKAWDIDGIVKEFAVDNGGRDELVEGGSELIQKLVKEAKGDGASSKQRKLAPLVWEDQPVPIRNPELVDVLLKVQDAQKKLADGADGKARSGRKGVAAFDSILSALSDAEEVSRRLAESSGQQATTNSSGAGTRDVHFVHAFIVYQLLSNRTERDLLLVKALITSATTKSGKTKETVEDARAYPAIVKLLDTIIQSLTQMRSLLIVDDNIDLAENVETRLAWTRARRCLYLSKCYSPLKKYAEALTLLQTCSLHLRDARSHISSAPESEAISKFYPVNSDDLDKLEASISESSLSFKRAWFTLNRGAATDKEIKKPDDPVLLNIAFQYIEPPVQAVYERAGIPMDQWVQPQQAPPSPEISKKVPAAVATSGPLKTPKEEEEDLGEEQPQQKSGGLSGLLGGWWGRS